MDVLATIEQEIHGLIRVRSQTFNWLLSAIYAIPRFVERHILWDNLKMLTSLHNLPWAFIGDLTKFCQKRKILG